MKKHLLTCIFAAPLLLFAQQTYTWNVTTGSWTNPLSWSPQRTTPTVNDVLEFVSNASVTDMPPTENIGKLRISNAATVHFTTTAGSSNIIIGHLSTPGPHLIMDAGTSLFIAGSSAIALNIGSGYTGEIHGNIDFSGGAHRLTAASAGGLLFKNGSVFTANTGFAGNAFGTASLNSVLFENGSTYTQKIGGSPFGATAPNSVCIFNAGSTYKYQRNGVGPSLAGRTFGHLHVDGNLNFSGIGSARDCIIQNDLRIISGQFSFKPNTNGSHTGNFKIYGDIICEGNSYIDIGSDNMPGGVQMLGANQTIGAGGGTGTLSFKNISCNNASTILDRGIVVNGILNLQNGKVISAANKLLTLAATASIETCIHDYSQLPYTNIGCDNSHIEGPVQKLGLNNADFAFPVGANSKLRPIILRNATGDFTVEYIRGDPYADIGNAMAAGIHHISHLEYWNITGTGTANLELTYYDPNSGGVTDMNSLRIAGYIASEWTDMNVASFLGNPGSNGSVTSATVTEFGSFTLAGSSAYPNNPLPLKLIAWKAQNDNKKVLLQWESAHESNIKGYIVERWAIDEFKEISSIIPAQNSLYSRYYTYDNQPLSGNNLYRLKIIDFDGRFEYSKTVQVSVRFPPELSVYPNPANEKIFIKISPSSSISALAIVNISGSVVKWVNTKNLTIVSVDILNLSPGLYYLKHISEQSTQIVPFIKYHK